MPEAGAAAAGSGSEGLLIRPATVADSEELGRVHVGAWRDAFAEIMPAYVLDDLSESECGNQWRDRLVRRPAGGRQDWVALAGAPIIGFSSCGPCRDPDATECGEIYAAYLRRPYWGRGIGRMLLEAAMDALAERNYDAVTLWVYEENTRARRFYEAAGFLADGKARTINRSGAQLPEMRYRKN